MRRKSHKWRILALLAAACRIYIGRISTCWRRRAILAGANVGVWGVFADCCIHDTLRFLPSQEWSTGERQIVGEFANCPPPHCRRRRQTPKIHTHSRSPTDHSCVGRNLTVSCRQMRQGRAFALGDSCLRRNGPRGNYIRSGNCN